MIGSYPPNILYPRRAVIHADEGITLTGNPVYLAHQGNQNLGYYAINNGATSGDSRKWYFNIDTGVYAFKVFGSTQGSAGMVDWYLDGVPFLSGQDWYSASSTFNVIKSGSFTSTSPGNHILQSVVSSKNASSSDFYFYITKILISPTAPFSD